MRFKPILILFVVFLCAVSSLSAASPPPPLALSDFAVNSTNPSYTFLGKGFAEIVAFELKKSPAVKLVDREKRNQILDEMEFGMTGLTDPAAQLEMGKLLSVRYLVGGSITDMGGTLLVSLSMVDVETGEVVWNDQVNAAGGKYAYIGAYFGKSLLKYFKAGAAKSTEVALKAETEKDAASVVALSQGIAALDKGDKEGAKKELTLAQKIDPGNAVAGAFLSKLASVSAKFKVVPERYVPYYNPAYLGGMEKDRIYYTQNMGKEPYGAKDNNNGDFITLDSTKVFAAEESRNSQSIGYALPITPSLGISFDAMDGQWKDTLLKQIVPDKFQGEGDQESNFTSLFLSAGLALDSRISLGLGANATYANRHYFEQSWGGSAPFRDQNLWSFGATLAAAVKNGSGTLIWDLVASMDNEKLYYFDVDPAVYTFVKYSAPLYAEQTLTLAIADGKAFLALKQANDIYFDRNLYYGRLMPIGELWFFNRFSLRAGVEGSLVERDGSTSFGWGGTAGASLRVWKLDIELYLPPAAG
jgi:TolB-like protein